MASAGPPRAEYSTRAEISVEGAPKQDEVVIDGAMLIPFAGAHQ